MVLIISIGNSYSRRSDLSSAARSTRGSVHTSNHVTQ